ncbi:MAG: hypothetical protein ABR880_21810 [Candidatus Sulfotelmatobacter sp.]|jgi:hypothetical protein
MQWTFINQIKTWISKHKPSYKTDASENENEPMTDKPKWTDVVMAFFTIVIAGAAILQWREMVGAGTQTDKLVEYSKTQASAASSISGAADDFKDSAFWMEQHMDDAANAIQDSVDTADRNTKTTIRNAQNAFRQEQRAWVGVLSLADSKGFTDTEVWKVKVVFFNSGRTPARNVQSSGMFITSPVPISGPVPAQIKQLAFRPAQSIAPQGSYQEALGTDYPAEASTEGQRQGQQTLVQQYNLIKNKKLLLYYFGILKYDDNSGGHHKTQYCISLANPDTKEPGFCEAFNDLN